MINNQGKEGCEYINKDLNTISIQELIKLAEKHGKEKSRESLIQKVLLKQNLINAD